MAKTTLINIKTGQEQKVNDAEAYMAKYKGVFKIKPAAQVSDTVKEKEEELDAKSKKSKELSFDGLDITEKNMDQFAKDNDLDVSKAKSADEKLNIVKKFIDSKN